MRTLRLVFVGGALTYRALFDWLSPPMFAATMLVTPVLQIYFFASLGPAYSDLPAAYFAAGNAVQICGMAGIYGVAQTIGNERVFGTLGPVLLSPANRGALYLGRALPHMLTAFLSALAGLGFAALITDFALPVAHWPSLLLVLAITAMSCTAIGFPLGAMGLLSREISVAAGIAYFAVLLVSGAAVPPDHQPDLLAAVAKVIPMTNGIAAVRHLAGTGPDAVFTQLLLRELAVGGVALALGMVVLLRIERRARRRGDLEVF